MLAEGNVSARAEEGTFYVKASGFSMRTIDETGFVLVRSQPILDAMESDAELDDAGVRALLSDSRVDTSVKVMPSVETFMHAYLLGLPDVTVVGHAHPTPLIALLALEMAENLAKKRIFPDEVVCCGPAAAFVPYVDPGLPLARAIRDSVKAYVAEYGGVPKTIWLQNHGLIALGKSNREIESAMGMSVKAARVHVATLSTGKPIHYMSESDIARIHTRPDEHYRQKLLWEMEKR